MRRMVEVSWGEKERAISNRLLPSTPATLNPRRRSSPSLLRSSSGTLSPDRADGASARVRREAEEEEARSRTAATQASTAAGPGSRASEGVSGGASKKQRRYRALWRTCVHTSVGGCERGDSEFAVGSGGGVSEGSEG